MRAVKTIYLSLTIFLLILIVISPEQCKNGVISGLVICGKIIIPSLFPFTVCVLFLLRCNISGYLTPLSNFTRLIFGQNIDMFGVMLLSFIGGYPIGGRLIREMCEQEKISKNNARIMMCYCINAGPAFIVVVVGGGILCSKVAGFVLLISHITTSLIIAIILKRFIRYEKTNKKYNKHMGFTDAFVSAVSDASSSVIGICSYVILFSAFNNYLLELSNKLSFLKIITYITEITTALIQTDNIYIISALLGFGGISIWCQVITEIKKADIQIDLMIFFRFIHAVLSCILTRIILCLFPVKINTFSNLQSFDFDFFVSTPSFSISLLIMIILLIISLFSKKQGGNLLSDIV